MDVAVERLYPDAVKFGNLKPSVTLTSPQLNSLRKCVRTLKDAEEGTAIIGDELHHTALITDVVLAGVFKNLRTVSETTEPGSAAHMLSSNLSEIIVNKSDKKATECEMESVFCQVSNLITPRYKHMTHMSHLEPYNRTKKDALLLVADIALEFNPGVDSLNNTSEVNLVHKGRQTGTPLHSLLFDAIQSVTYDFPAPQADFRARLVDDFHVYEMNSHGCPGDCPLSFCRAEKSSFQILATVASIELSPPDT